MEATHVESIETENERKIPMEKPTVLISACLLGVACRYDGLSKPLPKETLSLLRSAFHLVPVCPEIFGGLPTPRIPAEVIANEKVIRADGEDLTLPYLRGANEAHRIAELFGAKLAILKERSPSCGSGMRYDGTFSGKLTSGDGITAALFKKQGIHVVGESQIFELLPQHSELPK